MTVDDQLEAVVGLAGEVLGPDLVAVYLYGSAMLGGLQPRSDVDLLVLGARCLTAAEKRVVVDRLLEISLDPPPGWTRQDGERMLEVTVVSRTEIEPWRYPPGMDLQYGEWLRAELAAGGPLAAEPTPTPDVALLLENVRRTGRALAGPTPRAAIGPIPPADLIRATIAGVDEVLPGIAENTDVTNGLLTLARMWLLLETGEMAPKDMAADWAIPHLAGDDRTVLERARANYLGETSRDWRDLRGAAGQTGVRLAGQVRRAAEDALAAVSATSA